MPEPSSSSSPLAAASILGPHPSHPQNPTQLLQAGGEGEAGYAAGGSPHVGSHCTPQH